MDFRAPVKGQEQKSIVLNQWLEVTVFIYPSRDARKTAGTAGYAPAGGIE